MVYCLLTVSILAVIGSLGIFGYYYYRLATTNTVSVLNLGNPDDENGWENSIAETEESYRQMIEDFTEDNAETLQNQKKVNKAISKEFNRMTLGMSMFFLSITVTVTLMMLFQI